MSPRSRRAERCEMLVCESCGSENPDDVHFCVMCGAFLSKPVPSGSARELPAPDAPQPELREPRLEPFQPPRLDDQRSAPAAAPPPAPAAPVDPPDDAAAPPPWFRRTGVATRAAAPSQDLPTLADAPPFDPSAPERTDGLPGLAPAPPGLTARPPQRGQPARPAPPAPSRPQQALAVMLDQSVIDVQPGATASFRVAVRNTGALVEGCTVSVRGIPAAWQRMEPDRFNLDVDQQTDVQ